MNQSQLPAQAVQAMLALLHRAPGEEAKNLGTRYCYIWQKVQGQSAGRTLWYEVGDELPPFLEDADIYFSVHPCKCIPTTNQLGKPAAPYRVRGKVEDVASVACIFAEFDLHSPPADAVPGLPTAVEAGKAELLDSILAIDPRPSIIVDSGGGFHVYWLLTQAVVASRLAIELQANWVRRLASHAPIGADPASKDLARVLRLPGTYNHKYNPPRQVTIVHYEPQLTYSTAELRAALGPSPGGTPAGRFTLSFEQPQRQAARAGAGGELTIITVADPKQYMTRVLHQELRRIRVATEGSRNNALNQAAFALGRYVEAANLNLEALAGRLLEAATSPPVNLPRREAAQTISSALDAGMEEMPPIIFRTPADIIEDASTPGLTPQQLIELRREFAHVLSSADSTARDAWSEAAKEAGLGGKTTLTQAIKESRPTDADIRDAILERHPNLTYHPAMEWMHYIDGYWAQTPDHLVKKWISDVVDEVDRASLTAARVESVAKLLYYATCREVDDWDSKDVIVCTNGTLALSPGSPKLREHRRDDYSTHNVSYAFPKGHYAALCPAFLKVVSRLPEPVATFLQEYVGYCLTRDTRHDIMVWVVGRPGSGKSTLVRGILTALGGHATMVSLRELNRSRFALNNIVGKTLLYGTDVGTDFADNTDVLNSLVSGDPLRVESKYSNPIEITPTVKVLWAMTKKPALKDPDDGLFRRVQVVTMPPLPASETDPNIRVQVESEGPGILAWAIQGLLRLRHRGHFEVPKSVRSHTIQYRDDQDKTAHFIRDCLVEIPEHLRVLWGQPGAGAGAAAEAAPGEEAASASAEALMAEALSLGFTETEPVRAAALYRAYVSWCKISGYNALGKYKFYDDLRRLDLSLDKRSAGVPYLVCFSHVLRSQEEWDTEAVHITIADGNHIAVAVG